MRIHLPPPRASMVRVGVFVTAILACSDFDRVLGLSGDQAPVSQSSSARPEERRAVELSRTIPGLGGFYFDTAGNVIVAVKDIQAAATSRARLQPLFTMELVRSRQRHPRADLFVRVAQYSFLELRDWRDRLEGRGVLELQGVQWIDLDEVANRVVVGVEVGADAAVQTLAQQAGVPAGALVIQQTAPYLSQETLQDQIRPIQGGTQIQRVVGTSRATCTLGFAALWNNQQVFLTAGHCSPNLMGTDSAAQYQPVAPLTHAESVATTAIGREIFRYSAACGNNRCASSDAAIYGPVAAQSWTLGRVARPTYGCMPGPCSPVVLTVNGYFVIDSTQASFLVNDLIVKVGAATGTSEGHVTRSCVDVSPTHGVTYRCQMFANYGANDGDSGAPILLTDRGSTDTMVLGGVHSGKSGNNSVFSPWSGIVQDYGSLGVRAIPQDTSRPPVPQTEGLPDDSTRTFLSPFGTKERYYRDIVGVMFDDTTSGRTIRNILAKYQAVIVGGGLGFPHPVYHLQVPDPGGTYTALDSVARGIRREIGVFGVYLPQWRGRTIVRWRRPNDGPSARHADWYLPTDATRSLLAIRAPLAWGCETGTYGSITRVAIIDREFQPHNDLAVRQIRGPVSRIVFGNATMDDIEHGTRVAGIFGATGDNGIGIAGVMWNSDLTLYALGAGSGESSNPYRDWFYHLVHINDTLGTRILSMSTSIGASADSANVDFLVEVLRVFFQRGGILVYAVGNNPNARPTMAELRVTTDTSYSALDRAVAMLRDSLSFVNNIITVGATDTTGAFLSATTFWRGGTDILAPGQHILTLGASNTTSIAAYGTSFAVPYVTGVAAQLLTMDPTLTSAQVKGYILRGAQQARPEPKTGQMNPPTAVPGAPETIYQLDAYGSLTLLAAERQHIPLCGNRVWVQNSTLYAQRDTINTIETLAQLNAPRGYVNVFHGGRRIEVSDDTSTIAFAFQQGQWTQTPNLSTTPNAGTLLSMEGWSHDLDTLAQLQAWSVPSDHPDTTFVELSLKTFNPTQLRKLDTLRMSLAHFSGYDCIRRDWLGACIALGANAGGDERITDTYSYAPVGNRLFVAVSYQVTRWVSFGGWFSCPGPSDSQPNTCRDITLRETSERADIWTIDNATGVASKLWTIPGQINWLGVSEDGGQLVTGESVLTSEWTWHVRPDNNNEQIWSNPGTITGCGIHYRSPTTGAELRPAISTTTGCTYPTRGNGTITPVAANK